MIELLIGAALAAGAVSYVLRPIFRGAPGAGADVETDEPGAGRAACPSCGSRLNAGAEYCPQCGRRVGEGNARCRHCGTPLDAGARFCSGCGARAPG